jgi:hypothetical protein
MQFSLSITDGTPLPPHFRIKTLGRIMGLRNKLVSDLLIELYYSMIIFPVPLLIGIYK